MSSRLSLLHWAKSLQNDLYQEAGHANVEGICALASKHVLTQFALAQIATSAAACFTVLS